eukprot:Opistho-2@96972
MRASNTNTKRQSLKRHTHVTLSEHINHETNTQRLTRDRHTDRLGGDKAESRLLANLDGFGGDERLSLFGQRVMLRFALDLPAHGRQEGELERELVDPSPGNNKHVVVRKSSKHENGKADQLEPDELFPSKQKSDGPNEEGPAAVNGAAMGRREELSDANSEIVEKGNRNDASKNGNVELPRVSHLVESVQAVLNRVAVDVDDLENGENARQDDDTPEALVTDCAQRRHLVLREELFLHNKLRRNNDLCCNNQHVAEDGVLRVRVFFAENDRCSADNGDSGDNPNEAKPVLEVEAAAEKNDRKQGSEEHHCATEHLVHTR